MAEASKKSVQRPLSPHLLIYKPQMTSIMSIMHRVTGYALIWGMMVVVWMLIAAATGEGAYNVFMSFAGAWYGIGLMMGWTFALFYHMCNGIRHLFWDMGFLFKLKNAFRAGWVVWLVSLAMTVLVWYMACGCADKV